MNTNSNTYSLALRSPCEPEGWPCIDVFTLKCDGVELCDIHFAHSDENEQESCKIVPIKPEFRAADLPFIYSGFQLIGILQTILSNALTETGDEFYASVFYDEDGESRELLVAFETFKNT